MYLGTNLCDGTKWNRNDIYIYILLFQKLDYNLGALFFQPQYEKKTYTHNIINMNEYTTGYSQAVINTSSYCFCIWNVSLCVCMLTQQNYLIIDLAEKGDLKWEKLFIYDFVICLFLFGQFFSCLYIDSNLGSRTRTFSFLCWIPCEGRYNQTWYETKDE